MKTELKNRSDKIKERIGVALLFLIILVAGIILIRSKENPIKDSDKSSYSSTGVETSGESSSQQASNSNSKTSKPAVTTKININSASIEDLDTLTGIGAITAQKIIDFRTQKGSFVSIEGIKDVNGIGDSKYNAIKDLISI